MKLRLSIFFSSLALIGLTFSPAMAQKDAEDVYNDAKEFAGTTCGKKLTACAKDAFGAIGQARKACKQLRDCKKGCRSDKKKAKRSCKAECSGKKGKGKRQCMKKCKNANNVKGNVKGCKVQCRKKFKTPACIAARKKVWKGLFKCGKKLSKDPVCQKKAQEIKKALKKAD
jgi:hypothetical protein